MLLPRSHLTKPECNELRGCTETATTAPMTCNNSLCNAKSDHPHLLQHNEVVQPKWLHLLSLCTESGPIHSPVWQKSYKMAGCEKKNLCVTGKFMAITSETVYVVSWEWCAFCYQWTKNGAHSWCVLLQLVTAKSFSSSLPSSPLVCFSHLLCLIHREKGISE